MTSSTDDQRRASHPFFRANALFSGISGIGIAALSGWLPEFLGAGSSIFYLILGILLALYAIHLWRLAGRELQPAEGAAVVIGDLLWVVGSGIVVAMDLLTRTGDLVVAGVAVLILGFAIGQAAELRRTCTAAA